VGWHGVAERHKRLREAIDIIQGLLTGELTNYRGRHLRHGERQLYDRPKVKPLVVIAAAGPLAARNCGGEG
jgi:alkanesulfonate monooxygenase SsuD/methylene tetrahydromethanopterin reductase-like flavin-dependent oxidoreductase (luciferase family)